LSIGAGAIFQVVVEVLKLARTERGTSLFVPAGVAGLFVGLFVMVVTARS